MRQRFVLRLIQASKTISPSGKKEKIPVADREWKLVGEYALKIYPNRLEAGQKVALRSDIVVRDHRGHRMGKVYPRGEVWTVLAGVAGEPEVIWLRQANGERHTWDVESFFEDFDLI